MNEQLTFEFIAEMLFIPNFQGSESLQMLMEQWIACEGAWASSEFYFQCKKKSKLRHRGGRAWLTKSEIAKKYGSEAVAEAIIAAKEADPEARVSHIRTHPDMHGIDTPETCLHTQMNNTC